MKIKENVQVALSQDGNKECPTMPIAQNDDLTLKVENADEEVDPNTYIVHHDQGIRYDAVQFEQGELAVSQILRNKGNLGLEGTTRNEVITSFFDKYENGITVTNVKERGSRQYLILNWIGGNE